MVKFTLFFLSLSLLIILHEFGHYITARWFKTRVDKFYLFFDFLFPFGNLLKFSLFKKKIGDTTYGLGWFPFGGYVDIAGMAAEPGTDPDTPPAPDEFRGKKPWQRLIILAGGVTVNAILAVIIYGVMSFVWGESYIPADKLRNGIACDSLAKSVGLRDGDMITALDGKPVKSFYAIQKDILLDDARNIEVMRNGSKVNITLPENFDVTLLENGASMFDIRGEFIVDSVIPAGGAMKAGIMKGDSIFAVNGDTLRWFHEISAALAKHKNKEVTLGLGRKGTMMSVKVTLSEEGKMGVQSKNMSPEKVTTHFSFGAAFVRGFTRTGESFSNYVKQLPLLFTKAGASQVGGFASMGSIFPSTWDWQSFWSITALLSCILAFMNLLPIPVLDGGYILFVLWEMVTGRKPGEKFMRIAMNVGTFMVLALLIFANGNDLWKFIIKPFIGG
ncbi:MAG: RIP metalloprotease RseP [Bacteroidia bacterium]|nr:RIP metalloprotease RseP [Bacteroidia bacterium]